MTRHLLASDMDGTLFPSRPDPRHGRAVLRFQALLRRQPDLVLAYVTGRNIGLAQQAIEQWQLPWPDFLCPDLGTAVYRRYGGRWQEDTLFRGRMEKLMGGLTGRHLLDLLGDVPHLRPQAPDHQATFKTSFELPPGPQGSRTVAWTHRCLRDLGHDLSFVTSRDLYGRRLLLDILPRGVDKGTSVLYLQQCLGLPDDQVLFCGDSLNDLGAMLGPHLVTLPANADPRLRRALREAGGLRGDRPRCLFSSQPHLWGVLDGCRHFGFAQPG